MKIKTHNMIKLHGKRYRLFKDYLFKFGDACKFCDFNEKGTNDCLETGVDCQSPFGYFKVDERFKF